MLNVSVQAEARFSADSLERLVGCNCHRFQFVHLIAGITSAATRARVRTYNVMAIHLQRMKIATSVVIGTPIINAQKRMNMVISFI